MIDYFKPLKSFGNSDANLYEVGYRHCEPGYEITPYLPPHHVLHFIASGHGEFQVGGCTYELGPGDGMFSAKHVPVGYAASKTDPWYYLWFHFSGIGLDRYLHELRLSKRSPVFHVNDIEFCKRQIEDFYHYATTCDDPVSVEAYGLAACYSLFAEILRSNGSAERSPDRTERPQAAYVKQAIHYMNAHLQEPVRMTEIASAVGLNPNYLCSLFKVETGLSIQRYMMHLRLQIAQSLLQDPENSVVDVSAMVGYKNSASFCKAYKKLFHATPGMHR